MRFAALVVLVGLSVHVAEARQTGDRADRTTLDQTAQAYQQFLLGHHYEAADNIDKAIAAYKLAIQLDPSAADIPAELAALYMRQNRAQDALAAAEQALKIDPANHEAQRVAGFVYAALAEGSRGDASKPRPGNQTDENVTKAVQHLEAALDDSSGESDPNVSATLSRLYLRSGAYAKAIPLLRELVRQEPGWQDGPLLL